MIGLWYQGSGTHSDDMSGTEAHVNHEHERKRVYVGEGELICVCESDTIASAIVGAQNYGAQYRLY